MRDEQVWTIELNLADDYASSLAYHISPLKLTIQRNVEAAEKKEKRDPWLLVGLAYGQEEAHEKADLLRKILCERNKRKPLDLPF